MKGKYEVIKMIRENVLEGLRQYGITDWKCAEADQPGIQNMDKVVTLKLNTMRRLVTQGFRIENAVDADGKMTRIEKWIEQQEWEIKAIFNRKLVTVTENTMTAEDISWMLVAWFNGLGVAFFRKHDCSNLFVLNKDVQTYSDGSAVPENATSFVLKLLVPKQHEFKVDSSGVEIGKEVKVG